MQSYLQKLARLLQEQADTPYARQCGMLSVNITAMRLRLRFTSVLQSRYGSVSFFVDQRPELFSRYVRNEQRVFMRLVDLRQYTAGRGPSGHRRCSRSRPSRSASRSRSRSRSRRRSDADRSSGSGFGSGENGRGSRGHSPTARRGPGAGEPAEVPNSVCKLIQRWLEDLAVLLPPVKSASAQPNSIGLEDLWHKLPIPVSVLQHYGSVKQFVNAMPALEWVGFNFSTSRIYLVPMYHKRLLDAVRRMR